jgi:hypothetical protein
MELRGRRVLMVSALDRFGMAQALVEAGADVIFGDFIFALDLDRPVRGLAEFEEMARRYLPDACKLPFQFFYPTGKKQDRAPQPKYPEYYEDADVIAGDYHFMRQFMPDRLDGKTVLTNTVTANDIDFLRERGIARLVTTTPDFGGRSFGTNVVEAALVAMLGKRWSDVTEDDYRVCCASSTSSRASSNSRSRSGHCRSSVTSFCGSRTTASACRPTACRCAVRSACRRSLPSASARCSAAFSRPSARARTRPVRALSRPSACRA